MSWAFNLFKTLHLNADEKLQHQSWLYTLHTSQRLCREISSLNFHLRLRGAVLRLLNRRHFKRKKMNLSSIDFTAVGKSFQQRSPSVNYSVFFRKMICSESINVKPDAALRNHFIFHNGVWQRSGNHWLLREISRKWSRKIKISGAVVENVKKKQLWQHKDRHFWREKCVCCLNVKFSFYFLCISSVVGEWKWATEGLYWMQWLVPAVSTVHLSLWNASWFSEVPSGNKYAHTSWHREVKVGFCSTAVHCWKLPLLASATRAVSVETEVVSVQEPRDMGFPRNPNRCKALSISADAPETGSCRFL